MARKRDSRLLDTGDPFPALALTVTDGSRLHLPAGFAQPFNVVLVNRGAFCQFCTAQLRAFQLGLPRLTQAGIGVFSLSADPLERARGVVAEQGLTIPVGYGVSVDELAETLGVYYEPQRPQSPAYLQSAGFVLGPDRNVLAAVYSSGAIGRLVWQDVLGLVEYMKAHTAS